MNEEFIEHQKRVLDQKQKKSKGNHEPQREDGIQYTESKVKQANKKLELKQWKKSETNKEKSEFVD